MLNSFSELVKLDVELHIIFDKIFFLNYFQYMKTEINYTF